jgi:hypothetical protein
MKLSKIIKSALAILKQEGDVETSVMLKNADGSLITIPIEVVMSMKPNTEGSAVAFICAENYQTTNQ